MSKTKSVIGFVVMVVLIAFLAYLAAFGLQVGDWLWPKALDEEYGITRGLDLVGGSSITFEAKTETPLDDAEMKRQMDIAVGMLRERLDFMGYNEATVIASQDSRRVTIEIPSISDPEEAVQKLGSTAELEMIDGDGNVVLKGKEIKSAQAQYGQTSQSSAPENFVELEFTEEGRQKFAAATEKYSAADMISAGKNYISIKLDNEVKSTASFTEKLSESKVIIHGNFDAEEAKWLANIISAGQMPFTLEEAELRSVGPMLGEQALETCLFAGMLGLILVMVFMLVFYRVPGLLADIVLVGYVAIVALILLIFRAQINLTLPGIAGIILSIGMAVDANIIIFERIKEELRAGKSIKASIDAGFSRAFSAIIDSNITTLIAAIVLIFLGTGPIQGFGKTLCIGILVSMFTAIVLTRLMLKCAVGMNIRNPKLYGAKGGE